MPDNPVSNYWRTTVPRGSRWHGLVALSVGVFATVGTWISVPLTLPVIAGELRIELTIVQWVAVAVPLIAAVTMMPIGYISDIRGRKRMYVGGMIILLAGTVLGGLAPSFEVLISARLLQGLGLAMTDINAVAIYISMFPSSERGKALGAISTVVGISAFGVPVLGGFIVDTMGWRGLFLALAVPLAMAALLGYLCLPTDRRLVDWDLWDRKRLDWIGALLVASSVVMLVLALTRGPDAGWQSPSIWGLGACGAALVCVFVWWEFQVTHPLFDLRHFGNRAFASALGTQALFTAGIAGPSFLIPFFVQGVLGHAPSAYGLIAAPSFLVYALAASQSGRLSDRLGARMFMVGAPLVVAVGHLILALLSMEVPVLALVLALMVLMLGMGGFTSPTSNAVLGTVPRSFHSSTVAFTATVSHVLNVAGVALSAAIVSAAMESQGVEPVLGVTANVAVAPDVGAAFLVGARGAYIVGAVFLVLAAGVGFSYRSSAAQG